MTAGILGIPFEAAAQRLADYTDPSAAYAWPLYDDDPSRTVLTGADLAAPALLSYPIRGHYLDQMGCDNREAGGGDPNPYRMLFERMVMFVETDDGAVFHELPDKELTSLTTRRRGEDVSGPASWGAFIRCLDAAADCPGLTSVAVTKILHRKRPELVPLNDSRVREFFGVSHRYDQLFRTIHAHLRDPQTFKQLRALAEPYQTTQGRPMTPLRALDIIAWMPSS
jgi:hypothetical protein